MESGDAHAAIGEPTVRVGVAFGIPQPFGAEIDQARNDAGDPLAALIPSHITLQGPTDVPADLLPAIEKHLGEVAGQRYGFPVRLRGTGTFRPVTEVVFVAVASGISECEMLASAVRSGPLQRELSFPYHPHVTVAHDIAPDALDAVFESMSDYQAKFDVDHFTLYIHGADGTWRPVRDFPFGVGRNVIDRAYAAWDRGVAWARKRSSVFDHIWRAQERYGEVLGARLAAAIAYYGFFAALALSLLAFSVLGYLLAGDHRLYNAVDEYLAQNLPFLNTDDIQNSRQTIAIVSVVGLLFTGTSWIDGMRSSQRAVWRLDQQPGNVLLRRVIDLGMLVGLGLLLALSLGVASVLEWVVRHLLAFAEPERTDSTLHDVIESVLSGLGPALSFLVNMAVAAGLLAAVPRLHVPLRRLLPSVILVAGGLTLLSTVGRVLIAHAQYNPAYQVAGWAVGLLIFINLFSQLVLFGAALAATGQRGRVVDLAIRSTADPESDGDRG